MWTCIRKFLVFVILIYQIFNYKPPFTSIDRFKRQVKSGSLEVISIPAFFYPDTLHAMQSAEDSQKQERYEIQKIVALKN